MSKVLGFPLDADRSIALVTIISTLLLIISYNHVFTPYAVLDHALLFLFVPLFAIVVLFREHPKEFGFQLGEWRLGLALTAGAVLVLAPILLAITKSDQSMQVYYTGENSSVLPLSTFLDLIGWEFMFRGFLLFAYARKFGGNALWLQAAPFALAHITKPEIETLSTIFGGFLFGVVAWRTRSFLYPFLIHWFIETFIILVATGVIGP